MAPDPFPCLGPRVSPFSYTSLLSSSLSVGAVSIRSSCPHPPARHVRPLLSPEPQELTYPFFLLSSLLFSSHRLCAPVCLFICWVAYGVSL